LSEWIANSLTVSSAWDLGTLARWGCYGFHPIYTCRVSLRWHLKFPMFLTFPEKMQLSVILYSFQSSVVCPN
jgi:hypothetical protein